VGVPLLVTFVIVAVSARSNGSSPVTVAGISTSSCVFRRPNSQVYSHCSGVPPMRLALR
jgi:hypothetical protein